MAVSVRIEDEAFSDTRVEFLAAAAGWSKYEALGRLAYLWRTCTQLNSYFIPPSFVETILGNGGVKLLCDALLAEVTEHGVRVRGAKGRIEWLENLRKNGRKGGRPRKTKRKPSGFPELNPTAPVTVTAPVTAPTFHEESIAPSSSSSALPAVVSIPLTQGHEHAVDQAAIDEWSVVYPGVDVLGELRRCREWSLSNPKKRKTKSGARRFITQWLDRAQNSSRVPPVQREPGWVSGTRRFLEDAARAKAITPGEQFLLEVGKS
jgi:hypothetical protein